MRPQQQNRRMRGRNNGGNNNNNNGRKGPNPLTRNYESNGPDVKIRGSAQQIAEKYATLARDAQSAGDRVMAENYLQHAEHYNRIIAAAQAQMAIQHAPQSRDDFDDDDQDREEFDNGGNAQPVNGQQNAPASEAAVAPVAAPSVNDGTGPQPVIEGMPAEIALNSEAASESGNARGDNRGRGRGRRPAREPQEQPVAQADPASGEAEAGASESAEAAEEKSAQPRRGRRPRRGERPASENGGAEAEASSATTDGDDTVLAAANG